MKSDNMVMTWMRGSKGECLLGNNTTTIVFIPEGVSLASRANAASAISGGIGRRSGRALAWRVALPAQRSGMGRRKTPYVRRRLLSAGDPWNAFISTAG